MTLMRQRPGVTIMEVLTAAMILVISLVGVSMALTQALRKSSKPGQVEVATAFAAERLHYFRSQDDPFRAAGGTHYIYKDSDPVTYNLQPGANNAFNGDPQLFVREYLFDTTAGEHIDRVAGTDNGAANQRLRTLVGKGGGGINQIDPTRVVNRVFPGLDGVANQPATNTGLAGIIGINAPRANEGFPGASGAAMPPEYKYVREVWVETNHPQPPGDFYYNPGNLMNVLTRPAQAKNLPLYTVAVTVKVYARDPKTRFYLALPTGAGVPYRDAQFKGIGYDPTKPLAQLTGYFGLHRMLN